MGKEMGMLHLINDFFYIMHVDYRVLAQGIEGHLENVEIIHGIQRLSIQLSQCWVS
jgi:hypothetical protein